MVLEGISSYVRKKQNEVRQTTLDGYINSLKLNCIGKVVFLLYRIYAYLLFGNQYAYICDILYCNSVIYNSIEEFCENEIEVDEDGGELMEAEAEQAQPPLVHNHEKINQGI